MRCSVAGMALLMVVGAGLAGKSPAQQQPAFQLIHAFGAPGDGISPSSGVVFDSNGNLYGTTGAGGAYGYGTVYELSPQKDGTWIETVLHSFPNPKSTDDGSEPSGGVAIDSAGNLYGTTHEGGANGAGTIFELTPGGSGRTETILYNFCSQAGCADGGGPATAPVLGLEGNLYGSAESGFGAGEIYELASSPLGWEESVLYTFCSQPRCIDGSAPGQVVRDGVGNLYGPTEEGGSAGGGVVFILTPPKPAGGEWKERVLHSFVGGTDGVDPTAVTLQGEVLYGTTVVGGDAPGCTGGCGTVFVLTPNPAGGRPRETILHRFGDFAGGQYPVGGLAFDKAGNVYGTASFGGAPCGCGLVYELKRAGDALQYEILHDFTGSDGIEPSAGLTIDSEGNLYGTTIGGSGGGVVFEILAARVTTK